MACLRIRKIIMTRRGVPVAFLGAAVLGLSLTITDAQAGDRTSHYEPVSSNNLTEAMANFSNYNEKLASILRKKALSVDAMEDIHQITYTLEEAIVVMRTELGALAETLEALHLSSEEHSPAATLKHGSAYLSVARTFAP